MPQQRNYLLGHGERLTAPIDIAGGGGPKNPPYSFEEARSRVAPMLQSAAAALDELPERACPRGEAVASLTLHPEYYSKSYFPGGFLRAAGLRAVGSRPCTVRPEKRSRGREPDEAVTTELFVAGLRSSFHEIADQLPRWAPDSGGSIHLPAIERVSVIDARERVRPLPEGTGKLPLEVVLHTSEHAHDRFILAAFKEYLEELSLEPDIERIFFAGRLCFLRLQASDLQAYEVARFSFLRLLRGMPKLRTSSSILRGQLQRRSLELPQEDALDANLRVAVLDGGLSDSSSLTAWANSLEAPGVGPSDPDCLWHGETVTSALLFGCVMGNQADRPICHVDHHRVLDKDSMTDAFELYDVLDRVKSILEQGNYEFFNLSIGPELSVDDHDVHAWTAVLDEHLADGHSLASIAVGNTGEEPEDPVLQKWRVQVPSDCVNGLAVGASDCLTGEWVRASYSSKGPGRSPGIVKPDLITFGGSRQEPFWVAEPNAPGSAIGVAGTSYAAPAAMRFGVAIRAHFGAVLSPLAIKALMIHATDAGTQPQNEVGWGQLSSTLEDLVICPDGCVRVIYQDEITAARYRRIHLPWPGKGLTWDGADHCYVLLCHSR